MTKTPQPPRDWQKDWNVCLNVNDWHEYQWEAGSEEGSRVWRIHEIIPDEPCEFVAECETELVADFIMTAHEALPYWLQEAKIYKQSYEGTLTAYEAEKNRADTAEAQRDAFIATAAAVGKALIELESREQRLKEAIESAIKDGGKYENPYESLITLQSVLSTLYPDTPAPKEGE